MPADGRLFYIQCGRDDGARDLAHVAADPWRPEHRRRPVIHPDELAAYREQVLDSIRNPRPPTAEERRRYKAMMAKLRRRLRKHRHR